MTYDERLEHVQNDELRVRAGQVDREEGDERSGVDRGGLHERLDHVPLRRRARGAADAVLAHFAARPPYASRDEHCVGAQRSASALAVDRSRGEGRRRAGIEGRRAPDDVPQNGSFCEQKRLNWNSTAEEKRRRDRGKILVLRNAKRAGHPRPKRFSSSLMLFP